MASGDAYGLLLAITKNEATGVSTTQTAKARIQHQETATQTAKARISHAESKQQTAKARLSHTESKTQTGKARLSHQETKTQTAKGRLQQPESTTQTAKGQISIGSSTVQGARARIISQTIAIQADQNLIANIDKVLYTNYFPTDKLVGVFTGSVTMNSANSFLTSYQATALNTGLTTKTFIQMIWSTDGVNWQDGDSRVSVYSGGTIQYYYVVTAYSTATDVFVVTQNNGGSVTAPARTIYYKIFCLSIS